MKLIMGSTSAFGEKFIFDGIRINQMQKKYADQPKNQLNNLYLQHILNKTYGRLKVFFFLNEF